MVNDVRIIILHIMRYRGLRDCIKYFDDKA